MCATGMVIPGFVIDLFNGDRHNEFSIGTDFEIGGGVGMTWSTSPEPCGFFVTSTLGTSYRGAPFESDSIVSTSCPKVAGRIVLEASSGRESVERT